MREYIDRAVAKDELKRIDGLLDSPVVLIGGLAVQQYQDSRNSRDIDLVCDSDTVIRLIGDLYPSRDWEVINKGDDYRPNYEITHKVERMRKYFGPKVAERGEYQNLSWNILLENGSPFRAKGDDYLNNILVPSSDKLAYTKLISFVSRFDSNKEKSRKDFIDFIDLTNHKSFSASLLYDYIRQNGAIDIIKKGFQRILSNDEDLAKKLSNSCLNYFGELFFNSSESPITAAAEPKIINKKIYFAAPHKNIDVNSSYVSKMTNMGIEVRLPYEEVRKHIGHPSPEKTSGSQVRQVCVDAIVASDAVLVDVDHYGLDTAWEIGFAEGLGKTVLGVCGSYNSRETKRLVNIREYEENFMHGWIGPTGYKIYASPEEFLSQHLDDSVYVAGSFRNSRMVELEKLFSHNLKNVIFPKKYVPENIGMPKDYPLITRATAINQLNNSDVIAVILPKYGMDTSWQIGFCAAKQKKIVGIKLESATPNSTSSSYEDHWMHGWKEKDVFTGGAKMACSLRAFMNEGII